MNSTPMPLSQENGKKITIAPAPADGVALTVWAKNDSPKLVLWMTKDEARRLRALIGAIAA